jgi:transposase-like protein
VANSEKFIDTSTPGTPVLNRPPACPKCRSLDTSSAAKRPTSHSYWRCMKCGDVFSPALLTDASRRNWR